MAWANSRTGARLARGVELGTTPVGATNGKDRQHVLFTIFMVIIFLHILEHVAQAYQVYVLGWQPAQALGGVGFRFPQLVSSEVLHYGHALLMLAGLVAFRKDFSGAASRWWLAAILLQVWHHAEHLLLIGQAFTHIHLLGRPLPTSIAQLWVPRLELHLFYNAVVLAPMMIAIWVRRGIPRAKQQQIGSSVNAKVHNCLRAIAMPLRPNRGSRLIVSRGRSLTDPPVEHGQEPVLNMSNRGAISGPSG